MTCVPVFLATGVYDAGQELRISGTITFGSGDAYPTGGIPLTNVIKHTKVKSRSHPHTIKAWAYNPTLSTPATPVITTAGTPGLATWGYKIVAKRADGTVVASAEGTVATGNATLDSTNYNIVTFTSVTGAASYDVYRTTSGGTPGTTGKIANVLAGATLVVNDKALADDGASVPSDTVSKLYECWHDPSTKCLRMGGDSGECSSTTLTAVTINMTAWILKY